MNNAQQIVNLITQEIEQAKDAIPNAQQLIDTCDDWHTK